MTLEPYDSDRLDALALRILDHCARVRAIARQMRDEEIDRLALHDRKAQEYLDRFEEWLLKAEAELSRARIKNRGRRHAQKSRSSRSK